jgi:hypothetical protein
MRQINMGYDFDGGYHVSKKVRDPYDEEVEIKFKITRRNAIVLSRCMNHIQDCIYTDKENSEVANAIQQIIEETLKSTSSE